MASRKKDRHKSKVTTAVRLPPELLERLRTESAARDLPMSYLVQRAVREYLDRLIPVDEWGLTRDS